MPCLLSRLTPILRGGLVLSLVSALSAANQDRPRGVQTDKEAPKSATARTRTLLFTYGATVAGLPPGAMARIWLPVPSSNEDQTVRFTSKSLPAREQVHRDPKFGNEILFFEAPADQAGNVPFSLTYRVLRREVQADHHSTDQETEELERYLRPDAHVPVGGEPLNLLKDKNLPEDQLAAARVLYDVVNGHMRYSKEGAGWGQGDALWACRSGYGNCTDFHSLFISLARAEKIPAKFEIGFPLPPQRGAGEVAGYHCWAKFHPAGHGWIPVDISEANKDPKLRDYYFGNLTEDRVAFSTGRDLELVPPQEGKPINFFVYPYVEVGGKPYPSAKIKMQFTYRDVR